MQRHSRHHQSRQPQSGSSRWRLRRRAPRASAFALGALLLLPLSSRAQQDGALQQALASLELREIGPAVMGGRVTDIAGDASDPQTFYVGFASGGLWKTANHFITWTPLFDDQPTASIGAVEIAPSNPKLVWVGTGEADNRQSSTWGMGVFKSLDGGETWQHMGLENTLQIGRIVIHPTNPDIVYVAANGHLWGSNAERGVYKTVDGGQTWEQVLYVDEYTGAIDISMDPNAPQVLFAAMYQHQRTPWGYSADGFGSGIYRTLDGGRNWVELTADDEAAGAAADGEEVVFNTRGLPTGDLGRIGLDVHDPNGDLVYAVIESRGEGRGVYRSTDRGESWTKMSDQNPRPMYFSLLRIDHMNPDRIWLGGVELYVSDDAGRTWIEGAPEDGVHSDHHALWIDPNDSGHVLTGNDGGMASTWDGENWQHHHNVAVAQYYQIDVDMADPYHICGGLQDNNSWCGPSRTLDESGIANGHWERVWGGDGFWNVIDPTDAAYVYSESQNGRMGRYNRVTGESASLQPVARPTPADTAREYSYHWNTPILVSRHDPATVYVGANHLMRSRDRGVTWEEASPDLTRQIDRDTLPIMGMAVDSTTLSQHDGLGAYGTIVEIGESPVDPNVLYAGTDDGNLQVTRDAGATWTDITDNVPGLTAGDYVSAIEPSHAQAGIVYVAYDGHRHDNYDAHVFVSRNYGEDWSPITTGLPASSVNVIREHPETPELLFLGNEMGLFLSTNAGGRWARLTASFPTVPVDDIKIHPRDNDLVVATHGRSIWILPDVTPLQHIATAGVLAMDSHLFPVPEATLWSLRNGAWFPADDSYIAANPPEGARIRYWLAEDRPLSEPQVTTSARSGAPGYELDGYDDEPDEERVAFAPPPSAEPELLVAEPEAVELAVLNSAGEVIQELEGSGEAGIQEVFWDLRITPPSESDEGEGEGEDDDEQDSGPRVLPGMYTVRLVVGGETMEMPVSVRQDPRINETLVVLEDRQDALIRIQALAGPTSRAGQALDDAEERIGIARELLEKSGADAEALLDEADALTERIDALRDMVQEAGAGRLPGAIEGIADRPTTDQLWQIDQAWEKVPEAIRAVNELLAGDFADFEGRVYQPAARPDALGPVELPVPPM